MRQALDKEALKKIYGGIAAHYDIRHGLLTLRSDQRGRRLLVEHAVKAGDRVLDCGAGTGTTGLMAVRKVGPSGHVTLFDLSEAMLDVARQKAAAAGMQDRVTFEIGDLARLPFADNSFDAVLSTYSLCPVGDPALGAREMYRVTRPGGRVGVAHSTEPGNALLKWLADRVEDLAWHFPSLSMGCRAVEVQPALEELGARSVFTRTIGVPLWPFRVLVVEKPAVSD